MCRVTTLPPSAICSSMLTWKSEEAACWSMSRKLWVWFTYRFEDVHREVAPERPLLAAPQGYLRGQGARARLVGKHPYHPRSSLYLLEQALEHVGRAYP